MIKTTPPNTSHAVRSQRHIKQKGRDDFPTPPWATRALIHNLSMFTDTAAFRTQLALEPAAGRGHMADVLSSVFKRVIMFDKYRYAGAPDYPLRDFTTYHPNKTPDWIITNPPFNQALSFINHALTITPNVAMLCRLQLVESLDRYTHLFSQHPPRVIMPFVERVVMHKGKLAPKGSTATCYAWFVWCNRQTDRTLVHWIAPCRKQFERKSDYR